MAKLKELIVPLHMYDFIVPDKILEFYEKHKSEYGDNLLLCRSVHFGFFFLLKVSEGVRPIWFEKNIGDKNRFLSIIKRERAVQIKEKSTDAIQSGRYDHYSRLRVDGLQKIIPAKTAAKIVYNEALGVVYLVPANKNSGK